LCYDDISRDIEISIQDWVQDSWFVMRYCLFSVSQLTSYGPVERAISVSALRLDPEVLFPPLFTADSIASSEMLPSIMCISMLF
jgi:hypothetical protein